MKLKFYSFSHPFKAILLSVLSCSVALTSCTSMRWQAKTNMPELPKEPSLIEYYDFYGLGFFGKKWTNLDVLCADQKPAKAILTRSAEDWIISVTTLGIYTPRSLKVWCYSPKT